MPECKDCIHYEACMHLIDPSQEELTVCECFKDKAYIEELKIKNSNLTSDLTSARAEIERLNVRIVKLQCSYDCEIPYRKELEKRARAEAVKEFAERLKTKVDGWYYDFANFDDTMDALMEIANLVKEFTEGDPK